jgi:2-keto-4-pentenoate hydratase/2-oxohepta-3-ene-1,7-dioic acid hydratase in catechol pathway
MRFATVVEGGRTTAAVVSGLEYVPLVLANDQAATMRGIAALGDHGIRGIADWLASQPSLAFRPLSQALAGPAIPDPGAIYTVGSNYATPGEAETERPPRPLVYGKLPTAVSGNGTTIRWDRTLTPNVDPECELGVVIGEAAFEVVPEDAMRHVFGYTCINDISSRDPWLDGDQWLLGKSFPGFCPVGPWIVTRDELDPADLALGCRINGVPVQAGRTAQLRYSIAEVIAYLSRHTELRPGDLIATGTPARLAGPLGPDRHLEPGDVVTAWIERIGELTTIIG